MTRNLLQTLLQSGILLVMLLGFGFQRAAYKQATNTDHLQVRLWPKFGTRRDFSQEGWMYRKRAIACQIIAMVLIFVWWGMM